MTTRSIIVSVLGLALIVSIAATRAAHGQVPTAADFTACNDEAPKAIKTGSASPTTGDRVRADSARAGATTLTAGTLIESADPQIHGMSAEGAKEATYQAAYRTCMRRKGF